MGSFDDEFYSNITVNAVFQASLVSPYATGGSFSLYSSFAFQVSFQFPIQISPSSSSASSFPSFSTLGGLLVLNPPSHMSSAAFLMMTCNGPDFSLTRSERYCLYLPEKFYPLQKLMMGLTRTEGLGLRMGCPNSPLISPAYSFYMQSAYCSMMVLRATASDSYLSVQGASPQKRWSTCMSSKGFSQAIRPTMHPWRLLSSTICFAVVMLLMPPLIQKLRVGKSVLRRQTLSYISGGTDRFCAGFRPLRNAFLAWMMKCLMGPWQLPETSLMKSTRNSQESNSSTPSRHLTVHGMVTAFAMAYMHSLTSPASFMRQAPKEPFCTRGEGQPTFKLIQSYPYCWPRRAASARRGGSEPPSCRMMGCSCWLKGRRKEWLCRTASWCSISVQTCARRVMRRMKQRKCVFEMSIMGAMEKKGDWEGTGCPLGAGWGYYSIVFLLYGQQSQLKGTADQL